MSYLIRITDHVNKSDRIIHRLTNLDTYNSDFNTIINHLNVTNELRSTLSNGVAELSKNEQVVVPGYFYNSTKTVTTLVYTLSLIKVDENLSSVFRSNIQHESSQTTPTENTQDVQTKETQSESSTTDKSSQVSDEVNQLTRQYEETSFFRDDEDEEFGEFQSYVPEFTNVDLNTYDNVIIPPYTPYSPYCQQNFDSYNPFQRVMNLRGENQDVHFTFGSQVPRTPTQVVTSWAPELVNELKFRLAQPNAGLNPTNSSVNYFL